jgi:hypothetical protein
LTAAPYALPVFAQVAPAAPLDVRIGSGAACPVVDRVDLAALRAEVRAVAAEAEALADDLERGEHGKHGTPAGDDF